MKNVVIEPYLQKNSVAGLCFAQRLFCQMNLLVLIHECPIPAISPDTEWLQMYNKKDYVCGGHSLFRLFESNCSKHETITLRS